MCTIVFDCLKDSGTDFQLLLDWSNPQFQDYLINEDNEICGQIYNKFAVIEEIDILVRIFRKKWSQLQNAMLNGCTLSPCQFTQVRRTICLGFKLIIECLKNCNCPLLKQRYITSCDEHLKTLLPLITPLSETEKDIYLKLSNPLNNKEKCPIYQYFHTFLELHFYFLTFYAISEKSENLKTHVNLIAKDLVWLSEHGHKRNTSVFVCKCHKQIWLFLQILCEQHLEEEYFWTMFNNSVENLNNDYVLWLLKEIATLQTCDLNGQEIGSRSERIKPNFALVETKLKQITKEFKPSLLTVLKPIEPLVCQLWMKWGRIEVYHILWDYFGKNVNAAIRTNTDLSLSEVVDLLDTILWTPKDCQQDFELFVSMLTVHLDEHPHHWLKIKGRFYSVLSGQKILGLNNGGIFNVALLFLALTKVKFDELSKKFVNFVGTLAVDRRQSKFVWTLYSALLVRHVRENANLEPVTPFFIKMLEEASSDQKQFHLIKHFVNELDVIVSSNSNLQLHQWLLINTWIHKYMSSCYYADLVTLLKVLITILDKVGEENWSHWELTYKTYVYPSLKYSRSSPEITGALAAKIALLSPNMFNEAFTFFNSDTVPIKVCASFLCEVLRNYPNSSTLTNQQETMALQSWVKFCLLTKDSYEALTSNIVKLEILPEFVKNAVAPSRDPLCALFDCLSSDVAKHSQSETLINLCEIIFGQTERWINQYFSQPENEAIVLRIYTCLGLAFFKIGPLIYNKHKSKCPFARLVTATLLPTKLMVGKPLNPYLLQSIKKTWHLFFGATVKLNTSHDVFIARILREMVVRYLPLFPTVDSPMLKCLENEITADVILEKLSTAFFNYPNEEAESTIFKALKLVNEFVQSTTSINSMKLVVKNTLSGLFDIVMFHNQKNMAIATVKSIVASPLFDQVKTDFEDTIVTSAEKHLALNTLKYFQFLTILSKVASKVVKETLPRIRQQVSNVERMRGVGYDKNLRLNLERLEASLFKF